MKNENIDRRYYDCCAALDKKYYEMRDKCSTFSPKLYQQYCNAKNEAYKRYCAEKKA